MEHMKYEIFHTFFWLDFTVAPSAMNFDKPSPGSIHFPKFTPNFIDWCYQQFWFFIFKFDIFILFVKFLFLIVFKVAINNKKSNFFQTLISVPYLFLSWRARRSTKWHDIRALFFLLRTQTYSDGQSTNIQVIRTSLRWSLVILNAGPVFLFSLNWRLQTIPNTFLLSCFSTLLLSFFCYF